MRTKACRVMVSRTGGPTARQGHRCRAPDTAVMPPLTWKGFIVPPSARPGTGPNARAHRAGTSPGAKVDTAGAVLLSYCEVRHRAGPPGPARPAMAGLGKGPGHPVDNGAGLVADGVDSGPKGGPGPLSSCAARRA